MTNTPSNVGTPAPRRIRRALMWTTATAIALGGGVVAVQAAAAPTQDPDPTGVDTAWSERFEACLDGVAGAPDSVEQWVDTCRDRATSADGL